jgi:hypothetical protein
VLAGECGKFSARRLSDVEHIHAPGKDGVAYFAVILGACSGNSSAGAGPNAGNAIADRSIRENGRMCTTPGATKRGFLPGIPKSFFNREPSPTVNLAYSFCPFNFGDCTITNVIFTPGTVPATL